MIDLHMHTTGSDGILSVSELLKHAESAGVSHLSVTDHDSVASLDEMFIVACCSNLVTIAGIEFSCQCASGDYHLLGYNIDYKNRELLDTISFYSKQRNLRIDRIIELLNQQGVMISRADVLKNGITQSPGKPHIARALVEQGYVSSINDAFDRYLGRNSVVDVQKKKIKPSDAYKLIRNCGGLAVLAHPLSLRLDRKSLEKTIRDAINLGLKGIEVYSNMHSNEDVAFLENLAKKYQLLVTGGSDYHGDKDEQMGYYGADRQIPLHCADEFLKIVASSY